MMKLLDYYYLVLLRCFIVYFYVPAFMAFALGMNIFSLAVLFNHNLPDKGVFWIIIFAIGTVNHLALDMIYNRRRRDRIIREYKRESRESRRQGVVKVGAYVVLSIGFAIFSSWLALR